MSQSICRPALLVVLAGLAASSAHAQTRSWINPVSGLWNNSGNWSGGNVPDSFGESALLDLAGAYAVTMNASYGIGSLSLINPQNAVLVNNGLTLAVQNVTNNGTITISDATGGSATYLRAIGGGAFSGTGSIVLNATSNLDTATMYWNANSTTDTFTNNAGHTIRGTGNVYVALTNNGVVSADRSGSTLQLLSTNKVNNGRMEAVGGGVLQISGVTVSQSDSGVLLADGGTVQVANGAGVSRGTLQTNSGAIRVIGSSTLSDVTLSGPLNITNNSTLIISGSGLANDGEVIVSDAAGGSATYLRSAGDMLLSGTGSIFLNATSNLETATMYWNANSSLHTFTNGLDHTIRGTGNVHAVIFNQGLLVADQPGKALQLLSTTKQNTGTMAADQGGTLLVSGILVEQTGGGELVAMDGTVRLNSGGVVGGTIDSIAPSGELRVNGISSLTDVEILGRLQIDNNAALVVGGTGILNNGVLAVSDGAGGSATYLRANGAMSLLGSGRVVLSATGNLETATMYWNSNSVTHTFTNGPAHTIAGTGNIHVVLINNGLVTADESGKILQLVSTNKTNNARMIAENDGTLQVSGITVNQSVSGSIESVDGNLLFVSAGVTGGTVEVDAGATSTVTGTSTFSDVTLVGTTLIANNNTLVVGGNGLITNGVLRVSTPAGGSGTYLRSSGDMLLTGTGAVELDANPGNLDTAQITWQSNSVVQRFTNSTTHTIRGCGNIHGLLTNNGTVSADKPGATLQLLTTPKINQSLIRAINGGRLAVNGITLTQQNGGRLEAAGGDVSLISSTIEGGTLVSAPGSSFISTGTSRISNITLSGTLNVANNSTLLVPAAGITNNGVINVSDPASGSATYLRAEAVSTVSGNGTLMLRALSGNLDTAQVTWASNSTSPYFVNGPQHTLAGSGRIWCDLVNNGSIAPGTEAAAGNLDVRRTTTLNASSIARFKLGGTNVNSYDRITGTGTMSLNGTLRATFFGGFVPTVNDSFTIISGPTIVGEFSRIELPKGWWVEYGPNFVRAHYSGCLADWNYSGGVDGDDVIAFFDLWDAGDIGADINLDEGVDGDDVIDFFARWDAGC